ncbi:phosphodiester glycosidase family protein [Flavobacterium jejuense]|uniref:phosphodiester glycosidase family protein n=1 Tax=Flavobacterium jejuense TaxID=1544455 RepID=UPI001FB84926|nr:phosphodiester glycosidase family protein [Flavobacterium jejuense]
MKKIFLILIGLLLLSSSFILFKNFNEDIRFITYIVNLNEKKVKFYWKDENNINFRSIENLKNWLKNNDYELAFATNGGMYKKDLSPQGLYIENFEIKNQLDTNNGKGNFYLKPNGIFYITNENEGIICTTEKFAVNKNIKFATQSGPMLVIENKIHPAFKEGSKNLNIRNGVSVLDNGNLVFVMSKKEINFYDFATYFKQLGCKNALYLDGYVSRTYLPEENWIQTDGNFGVLIGVTNNK